MLFSWEAATVDNLYGFLVISVVLLIDGFTEAELQASRPGSVFEFNVWQKSEALSAAGPFLLFKNDVSSRQRNKNAS